MRARSLILIVLAIGGCSTERPVSPSTLDNQPVLGPAVRVEATDCLSTGGGASAPAHHSASAGPAPPSPAPPNASRVVADVLKRSVWAPGTLPVPPLPSNPDRTVYSLTLSLASSAALAPEYENLAFPGSTVEAFSCAAIPADLSGKRIEAVLVLRGEVGGTRWWISHIHALP